MSTRRGGIDKQLNIAVAGCGTAGLATALLLSRDGHRVTMFERFDEPRALGSGLMLQPTGLAVLRQLGLDGAAIAKGARIERLHGQAGSRTVLDVRYSALGSENMFGLGIHRAALFNLLHDAVQAEAIEIRASRQVAAVRCEPGGAILSFGSGPDEGPFDFVVDALGSRSPLAPKTGRDLAYGAFWTNVAWPGQGFETNALSQRYCRASSMAGVMPMGIAEGSSRQAAFFWSIRADQVGECQQKGLRSWKDDVLRLWPATAPILDQISSFDELTFARYSHRTVRRPVAGHVIHVGDSWHSASPQLGQGANMALLDAYALSIALRHCSTVDAALLHAIKLRRRHIQLYQILTALLTPVYQSDSRAIPMLRDWLMGPLSKIWPLTSFQAALVSGLVGSPLKKLGIDFAPHGPAR